MNDTTPPAGAVSTALLPIHPDQPYPLMQAYLRQAGPGEHRWVVLVTHQVDAARVAEVVAAGLGEVDLDEHSVLRIDLACFMCEQAPTPELVAVPCPGGPLEPAR